MNNDNRKNNMNNNNNNYNYHRRSSRYSNNKNYRGSNYKSSNNNYKKNNVNKDNKYRENHNQKKYDEDFTVTKQQVFDFDEMTFSDELDTSFVENKRKKKQQIVEELNHSYEKEKAEQVAKREKTLHKKSRLRVGRVIGFVLILILLIFLLITCIYIITRPEKKKVVTKEKEVMVVDDNYLFLGDSITEQYDLTKYFKNMPVVNSGVSGNQTADILGNMKERVYQYNPSKVFLLIGTNDIEDGVDEEDIIHNIEEILTDIRSNRPYAELYLEAIYPVDEDKSGSGNRTNEEIVSINETLEKFCKKQDITFIDTYNLLLDSDSEEDKIIEDYSKDGLHLTDEGYQILTDEIMKYLK